MKCKRFLLFALFILFFLSSCADNPVVICFYVSVDQTVVVPKEQVTELPEPEREGYIFEGWYLDRQFQNPFSISDLKKLDKSIILYPKWTLLKNGEAGNNKLSDDIDKDDEDAGDNEEGEDGDTGYNGDTGEDGAECDEGQADDEGHAGDNEPENGDTDDEGQPGQDEGEEGDIEFINTFYFIEAGDEIYIERLREDFFGNRITVPEKYGNKTITRINAWAFESCYCFNIEVEIMPRSSPLIIEFMAFMPGSDVIFYVNCSKEYLIIEGYIPLEIEDGVWEIFF
jgi:uncharacterized repeat protein (TIGR02543 family)